MSPEHDKWYLHYLLLFTFSIEQKTNFSKWFWYQDFYWRPGSIELWVWLLLESTQNSVYWPDLTLLDTYVSGAQVHCGTGERKLLNDLMTFYQKLERPVANESEAVQLRFGLTLQQIMDVVREAFIKLVKQRPDRPQPQPSSYFDKPRTWLEWSV